MPETVAVIDYGMGNLHSVASALRKVGASNVVVSADADFIRAADRVILPGVGAIRDCMGEIRRLGFDHLVPELVANGRPLLGVCVGLQSLMDSSEENGGVECLGVFPGEVRYFGDDLRGDAGERLKVPHMGWNNVSLGDHALWHGLEDGSRFYFVHSYHVASADASQVHATANYGLEFDVALARDAVFAVQFHPEKSGDNGMRLLNNFLQWKP